jgi:hypothetical protein
MEQRAFQDEAKLLSRIGLEYGQALLGMLPTPSPTDGLTLNLCEGYMTFTLLMLRAVRAHQVGRLSGMPFNQKRALWRRAKSMRTAWDVLHRYVVALQLLELEHGPLGDGPADTALLAERCVEALTDNIDLGPVEED